MEPSPLFTPQEPKQSRTTSKNMAAVSLAFGFLSLALLLSVFGTLIFGSLSILFALLSRTERTFPGASLVGMVISFLSLLLLFFLGISVVMYSVQHPDLLPPTEITEHILILSRNLRGCIYGL